jgi:hypothetical protein
MTRVFRLRLGRDTDRCAPPPGAPDLRGYRVFGPDGYLGVVEHVSTEPRPTQFAVVNGLFVRRSLLIPLAAVNLVLPKEGRVLLGRGFVAEDAANHV